MTFQGKQTKQANASTISRLLAKRFPRSTRRELAYPDTFESSEGFVVWKSSGVSGRRFVFVMHQFGSNEWPTNAEFRTELRAKLDAYAMYLREQGYAAVVEGERVRFEEDGA